MHSRDPREPAKFDYRRNGINASANGDLIIDGPRGTNNPVGTRDENSKINGKKSGAQNETGSNHETRERHERKDAKKCD
jgi:hypothetical protein